MSLIGDYNVVSSDGDTYSPRTCIDNALLHLGVNLQAPTSLLGAIGSLSPMRPALPLTVICLHSKAGPTLCARCIRPRRPTRSGTTAATDGSGAPGCASTTCCSARR